MNNERPGKAVPETTFVPCTKESAGTERNLRRNIADAAYPCGAPELTAAAGAGCVGVDSCLKP